ncbi:hypothetical protein QP173_09440, partial [Aerococcus urinae]
ANGIQGREGVFITEGIGTAGSRGSFLLRFGQIDMDRFAVIPAHPAPHFTFLTIIVAGGTGRRHRCGISTGGTYRAVSYT